MPRKYTSKKPKYFNKKRNWKRYPKTALRAKNGYLDKMFITSPENVNKLLIFIIQNLHPLTLSLLISLLLLMEA